MLYYVMLSYVNGGVENINDHSSLRQLQNPSDLFSLSLLIISFSPLSSHPILLHAQLLYPILSQLHFPCPSLPYHLILLSIISPLIFSSLISSYLFLSSSHLLILSLPLILSPFSSHPFPLLHNSTDREPEDSVFSSLLPLMRDNLPKKLAEVAWDRVATKFPVQYQVGECEG